MCNIDQSPFKSLLCMQDIAVLRGVISFLSKAVLIKQTVLSKQKSSTFISKIVKLYLKPKGVSSSYIVQNFQYIQIHSSHTKYLLS